MVEYYAVIKRLKPLYRSGYTDVKRTVRYDAKGEIKATQCVARCLLHSVCVLVCVRLPV